METSSAIGFVRPLLRYASPTSCRKRIGEWETLLTASKSSFPRGDRPNAITVMPGSTALSAS
jgi:hypothetical protein